MRRTKLCICHTMQMRQGASPSMAVTRAMSLLRRLHNKRCAPVKATGASTLQM